MSLYLRVFPQLVSPSQWLVLFSIIVPVAMIIIFQWGHALRYQPTNLNIDTWWSFITGHFVHLNISHGILNLIAWCLIWLYARGTVTPLLWLISIIVCTLGTSLGLLWISEAISWYVGLSGMLHGLLFIALYQLIRQHTQDITLYLVTIVLIFKLIYENQYGPVPGTAALAGGNVISDAHLYGAISGALVCACLFLITAIRKA